MKPSFKKFWKEMVNKPQEIEIRQDGDQWITAWKEGDANFEEAFRERLQAEEKASALNGEDITYDNELPTEKFMKTDDKLSQEEIREVQKYIEKLQSQGQKATDIIKKLQNYNDKLSEYYKAKRAFETENKNAQSKEIINSASNLDINKFKVMLNPNACKTCRQKTENGRKIFTEKEITKSGFGMRPPFHPNCTCLILPY
jgi:hypothetical protein